MYHYNGFRSILLQYFIVKPETPKASLVILPTVCIKYL